MIKSEFKEPVLRTSKPYPKMMMNVGSCYGMVVLFESAGKGVVVAPYGTLWKVGEYREDWAISQFADFDGSIMLSNE